MQCGRAIPSASPPLTPPASPPLTPSASPPLTPSASPPLTPPASPPFSPPLPHLHHLHDRFFLAGIQDQQVDTIVEGGHVVGEFELTC